MAVSKLHIDGEKFIDHEGRQVILRGVNLGGDCKLPYPGGGTQHPSDFSDHREVSFIGRPFPLDEADEHFSRLAHWGFNCLRLLTSWEAIEHAGPGEYDEAYLDYFTQLCEKANDYGFYVYVDFHQDVWSRMSGGDGAPGWCFEKVGLDFRQFDEAEAAFVMQYRYDYKDSRPRQNDNYPQMSWIRNYAYAANGIMWTLFFGGKDFAPQCEIDGQNVQDYLQSHFINAQKALAKRIAHLTNVIGFDALNEPSAGWIGKSLSYCHLETNENNTDPVLPGLAWSPVNALRASHGVTLEVPYLEMSLRKRGIVQTGTETVNKKGVSIWFDPERDPFQAAGAYKLNADGRAEEIQDDFFQKVNGKTVVFAHDYLGAFYQRVASALREENPDWFVFIEPDLLNFDSDSAFPKHLPERTVNAGHSYDISILLLKRFSGRVGFNVLNGKPRIGRKAYQRDFVRQFDEVKKQSKNSGGGCPTLIGEFGIPFDMNGSKAYQAYSAGDHSSKPWRAQAASLDLLYNALDELLLSSTQWNYTASNSNLPAVGDGWNQEDLSIYSPDQKINGQGIDSGGRALAGFVRPYVRHTQGTLTKVSFDEKKGCLKVEFNANCSIDAPTEIYLPALQFPAGYVILTTDCSAVAGEAGQVRHFYADASGPQKIEIRRI